MRAKGPYQIVALDSEKCEISRHDDEFTLKDAKLTAKDMLEEKALQEAGAVCVKIIDSTETIVEEYAYPLN